MGFTTVAPLLRYLHARTGDDGSLVKLDRLLLTEEIVMAIKFSVGQGWAG